MTAEGRCNIVWGGDFKDTLRFQTSNFSFSFDATFRFADYISTYAECSSAFDKDTIILHVERKDLEHLDSLSLVRQLKNENVGVYTISRTDFLHIMFQQMEQNIIQEVWQLFKQVLLKIELSSKMILLARFLRDCLTEIIQRYEKQQSQQ